MGSPPSHTGSLSSFLSCPLQPRGKTRGDSHNPSRESGGFDTEGTRRAARGGRGAEPRPFHLPGPRPHSPAPARLFPGEAVPSDTAGSRLAAHSLPFLPREGSFAGLGSKEGTKPATAGEGACPTRDGRGQGDRPAHPARSPHTTQPKVPHKPPCAAEPGDFFYSVR